MKELRAHETLSRVVSWEGALRVDVAEMCEQAAAILRSEIRLRT